MNPESYFTPTYNAGFQQYPTRQQRGHIKWNQVFQNRENPFEAAFDSGSRS